MSSVFSIFRRGLEKTATAVSRSVAGMFSGVEKWDERTFEELESRLILADFGVKTAADVVSGIRDRYERGRIATSADVLAVAENTVADALRANSRPLSAAPVGTPTVILFAGVNGSGKTTTIGKLAHKLTGEGKKTLMAAADTFRAAAVEQLRMWGERTGCEVIYSGHGADPASVAFDAAKAAVARQADFLLVDTAGRQQNSRALMDELAKIKRSLGKACAGAPHEVWLTVDASCGGNALSQAREFSKAVQLTGVVLTKLDGSGKGGMAAALNAEFKLPVFYAGLGEQPDDLQEFDAQMYSKAIFGTGD